MKQLLLFVFLFLSGCASLIEPAATPSPAPVTLTYTVTTTPTKLTPTFTVTPTVEGGRPVVLHDTPTELPTVTRVVIKPKTSTPGLSAFGINNIFVSDYQVYYGNCEPNQITFKVWTSNTQKTKIVETYVRLKSRIWESDNAWDALTMHKIGVGVYSYTYPTENFSYHQELSPSWLQYQVVSFDADLHELARTPIFENKIMFDPCPTQ